MAGVVGSAAWAQTVIPAERGAGIFARASTGELKCQVRPLRPVLDFSFRFRAGYTVAVPLNQYQGPGHRWSMLVRLQAGEAGQPVYFVDRIHLPDVPPTGIYGEVGGGYVLGEGTYRASFLLRDEQGRACRADWNIEARLGPAERHVKLSIDPGTAEEASSWGRRPPGLQDGAPLGRMTVLLHAAPTSPNRTTMQASDAVTLLGALSSLLDLAPADSVRLVVFNLDRQKEIYRRDHFTPDQMEAVRQAMFNLRLGIVDFQTLQHPEGRADLLAGLVNKELEAQNPSDAVVFLGPHSEADDKLSADMESRGAGAPRFFYLQYQRPAMLEAAWGRLQGRVARRGTLQGAPSALRPRQNDTDTSGADAILPPIDPGYMMEDTPHDSIERVVAVLKGKTQVVRTPDEFARAMTLIARGK